TGAPALLELPTSRSRPAVRSSRGAMLVRLLPRALHDRIEALAHDEGATPFMVLMAALQALLHRLSGAADLSVGFAVANRGRPEIEGLIGFFVNTLVLRADLSGLPSFRALLRQIRERTLAAYAHQDVPFERVVEELRPERSLSHTPLFQVMLVLQNTPQAERHAGIPELPPKPVPCEAKFDLTVNLQNTSSGLIATWEYSTDLFDDGRIAQFADAYTRLLTAAVEDADRLVLELPLLSADERKQLLEDWNATALPYGQTSCVHELIAEQAQQWSEKEALRWRETRVS